MINENAEIPAPTADVPVADVASLPVSSITLKLPPFWPNDPLVWFAQVEAQFHTRNITSQPTKFAYIVSSLQPEIAQEIRDILLHPPVDRPYDTLKSELIKRTSASEHRTTAPTPVAYFRGTRGSQTHSAPSQNAPTSW